MSIAGIEKVREAELEADRLKKSADEEASGIVADGKRKAREMLEQASKDAETAYKKAMEEAEAEATAIYDQKIAEEKASCEKIKENARADFDSVVHSIVGKVVGSYGNS